MTPLKIQRVSKSVLIICSPVSWKSLHDFCPAGQGHAEMLVGAAAQFFFKNVYIKIYIPLLYILFFSLLRGLCYAL